MSRYRSSLVQRATRQGRRPRRARLVDFVTESMMVKVESAITHLRATRTPPPSSPPPSSPPLHPRPSTGADIALRGKGTQLRGKQADAEEPTYVWLEADTEESLDKVPILTPAPLPRHPPHTLTQALTRYPKRKPPNPTP